MDRTTLEVPMRLKNRIKAKAAVEGKPMKDLVVEVLEAAFPADEGGGKVAYSDLPIIKAIASSEEVAA